MASNFDRFTPPARKVLSLAQVEARRFKHPHIGSEHLLLGLVREGEGVAACVLSTMGVQLPEVRSAVEFIIGRGEGGEGGEGGKIGEMFLTLRAKKIIELAVDEARHLGHSHIGTAHLLLGFVREERGIGDGILGSLGVDAEKVHSHVMQVIAQSKQDAVAESSPRLWRHSREALEAEKLVTEIAEARAMGNSSKLWELEANLAKIQLRRLDRRRRQLVEQLIKAEQRRLNLDDEIRQVLADLDMVKRLQSGHHDTIARQALEQLRRKREQEQEGRGMTPKIDAAHKFDNPPLG